MKNGNSNTSDFSSVLVLMILEDKDKFWH